MALLFQLQFVHYKKNPTHFSAILKHLLHRHNLCTFGSSLNILPLVSFNDNFQQSSVDLKLPKMPFNCTYSTVHCQFSKNNTINQFSFQCITNTARCENIYTDEHSHHYDDINQLSAANTYIYINVKIIIFNGPALDTTWQEFVWFCDTQAYLLSIRKHIWVDVNI